MRSETAVKRKIILGVFREVLQKNAKDFLCNAFPFSMVKIIYNIVCSKYTALGILAN